MINSIQPKYTKALYCNDYGGAHGACSHTVAGQLWLLIKEVVEP